MTNDDPVPAPAQPGTSNSGRPREKRAAFASLPPNSTLPSLHVSNGHKAQQTMPRSLLGTILTPYQIFSHFFIKDILEDLVANTNSYTEVHGVGQNGSREWVDTNFTEMRI